MPSSTRAVTALLALSCVSACVGLSHAIPPGSSGARSYARKDATGSFTVTDLGTLGGSYSSAQAINALGEVTGISSLPDGSDRAFIYSVSGGMVDLGTLGGTIGIGNAINRSGEVAGYATRADGTYRAFLYADGKMNDIGDLGGGTAAAWGINDAGMVVGDSLTADGYTDPFLYKHGKFVDLGSLGGHDKSFYNNAYGINDSKEIVGLSWDSAFTPLGFLWRKGKMNSLGTLGGEYSDAFAINRKGQITGEAYTSEKFSEPHAFRWTRGKMKDLGILAGGVYSWGYSINSAGVVVGFCAFPEGSRYVNHAFIYRSHKMRDLNDLIGQNSGWLLNDAYGINDSGQIVGDGSVNGQIHAFLLTPQ
jgi:probable HAF family extracellular repeat protein